MKLMEYKDEEALDLLAEILEPTMAIMQDKEVSKAYKSKDGGKMAAVIVAVKRHKEEIMTILAAMDGVPVKEYHCNILTIPQRVIEIISDPEIKSFFSSAVSMVSGNASGGATEDTEDAESIS